MQRLVASFITVLALFMSASTYAVIVTELQGYGAFNTLNKDWMLLALYSDVETDASKADTRQRLEIKIETDKLTARCFRTLWLEALTIEYGSQEVDALQADLHKFFSIVRGPLKKGDVLIVERNEDGIEVRVNYHRLAQLSDQFLDVLVQSLVGKHPPTRALKSGLRGEESLRQQTNLAIRFDRLEPTLPRIAEISAWRKGASSIN